MKENKFVKGCIIIFISLGIVSLLLGNFNSKLNSLLKSTPIDCNEDAEQCYNDLKNNVFFSSEGKSVIMYTSTLTLITLNVCAFLLLRFCSSDIEEEENKSVIKSNKKWQKKKKK